MEIPQRAGEQRDHPVLVQARLVGGGQPAEQGLAQPGELGESDLAQRGLDERALPGPAGRQALGLQVAVGLQHRVRVDRQRGDHVPDLGQLITGLEVAEPQRVLDLLDELQVGRHPRGRIQPELDRRRRPARHGPLARPRRGPAGSARRKLVPFIYCHKTRIQLAVTLSSEARGLARDRASLTYLANRTLVYTDTISTTFQAGRPFGYAMKPLIQRVLTPWMSGFMTSGQRDDRPIAGIVL